MFSTRLSVVLVLRVNPDHSLSSLTLVLLSSSSPSRDCAVRCTPSAIIDRSAASHLLGPTSRVRSGIWAGRRPLPDSLGGDLSKRDEEKDEPEKDELNKDSREAP